MIKKIATSAILIGALTIGGTAYAEEGVVEENQDVVVEEDATSIENGEEIVIVDPISVELESEEETAIPEDDANTDGEEGSEETDTVETTDEGTAVVTPDSYLYEVILLLEEATLDLTEGSAEKALLKIEYADKRLSEAKQLIESGNEEMVDELIEEHEDLLEEVEEVIEEAVEEGEGVTEVEEVMTETIAKRSQNLLALLEREDLPEQAKAGIAKALANQERAMERAAKSLEKAIEEAEEELEKVEEEREKEEEKAEKTLEKAEKKAEKALEKAEKKAEKALEKAEKKAEKALKKAIEKNGSSNETGNGRP